jgi:hypothetical protein
VRASSPRRSPRHTRRRRAPTAPGVGPEQCAASAATRRCQKKRYIIPTALVALLLIFVNLGDGDQIDRAEVPAQGIPEQATLTETANETVTETVTEESAEVGNLAVERARLNCVKANLK